MEEAPAADEPPMVGRSGGCPDRPTGVLLCRGDDLLLLGVRFVGFRPVDDVEDAPAVEATDDALLVVTLPPQHLGEWASRSDGQGSAVVHLDATGAVAQLWEARLAGPGTLVFQAPRSTRVPLTVAGLLGAMRTLPVLPGAQSVPTSTRLEIPWGLLVTPVPVPTSGSVACHHAVQPQRSSDGVTGLWRTRLHAVGATLGLGTVAVRAVDPEDPYLLAMPLDDADRRGIALASGQVPASVRRLELSALGGSLSVDGDWASLSWRHETAFGRDQMVRVVRRGMLYPLRHPAVYIELTQRTLDPAVTEPVAKLIKRSSLIPDRSGGRSTAATRDFPFHTVEILRESFEDLSPPRWRSYKPVFEDLSTLADNVERTSRQMAAAADRAEQAMRRAGWKCPTADWDCTWLDYSDQPPYNRLPEVSAYRRAVDAYAAAYALYHAAQQWLHQPPVDVCFLPERDGQPIRMPVRLHTAAGHADVDLPLVFVADVRLPDDSGSLLNSLTDPAVLDIVGEEFARGGGGRAAVPGVPLDLLADGSPGAGSGAVAAPGGNPVYEVHHLVIENAHHRVIRPTLTGFGVRLPELRALLGDGTDHGVELAYTTEYLNRGEATDVVFRAARTVEVDFTGRADRAGGLLAPRVAADAISRRYGPVNAAGAVSLAPADLFHPASTVLGFQLTDLVGSVTQPPAIAAGPGPDGVQTVTMTWPAGSVRLKSHPPFHPGPDSTLALTVTSCGPQVQTECTVTDFALDLPPQAGGDDARLLRLEFAALSYHQRGGEEPTVAVTGLRITFLGPLLLLAGLQTELARLGIGRGLPRVDVSPAGVTACHHLALPQVTAGAFVLRGIAFHACVDVPFDGRPLAVRLAFASRHNPFVLSVLMFGGGGYLELEIDRSGLRRLEVSLEFGAAVTVDFGVARAEVHALGGVRYIQDARGVVAVGFLRIGGSVEVLGLVSVCVELTVELTYDDDRRRLYGRATLVLEIDLTFYSDRVELDSGEWLLTGGDSDRRDAPDVPVGDDGLAVWRQYQEAFADE